ncbi:MAG TPA: radical SAM family heme chaperone HemW [Kiritimatiellia bacterium]|nr:radical SAM family heme chaperone HemW [Kiritimatiellia bacterium]HMO98004.1 radical SAM family heme chaperone HemW [Kiritimatiellia bacterium]HMP95355.1 radical SAM family heme chaperone HemW [Kiritimatiellia bacterium]
MTGLYIHIPFCVRKCLYCDFYSLPTGKGPLSQRLADVRMEHQPGFLEALEIEVRQFTPNFQPETIFIGGGTPTELSDDDFRELFRLIHRRIDVSCVKEWTCESNPGTLTESKVDIMVDGGVNRVSLGVQSLTPSVLEFIGRIHSPDEALAGYRLLREKGVRNINLDFMYGIPGQNLVDLERDLKTAVDLAPEHLACYCLIFEDGTPLTELRDKGYLKEVDSDIELTQYDLVQATMAAAGYRHYEISNFARPGFECAHNLLYWSGGEYLGCGPSAHSHWQGTRWGNIRNLEAYNRNLGAGRSIRQFEECLSGEAKARETLVMYLRRIDGVSRDEFRQATGYALDDLCGPTLRWLTEIKMLDDRNGRIQLTRQGLFVSDSVFAELV